MFSSRLINELGLIPLVKKGSRTANEPTHGSPTTHNNASHATEPQAETTTAVTQIDKNEFRLLVKMLKAINIDCQFDHIEYHHDSVKYHLPNITLVFNDIALTDDAKTMNLCSLKDLLHKPELKRPVWEKLKTL
jgi:hypothetical protein